MKIYDDIILETEQLFASREPRVFAYEPKNTAALGEKNELILVREAAFELGEGSLPSVSFTVVTDSEKLLSADQTLLFGKDLLELSADAPFARITILCTDDLEENGEQGAYGIIKNIDMKKCDISPKGYMMRAAALSNREQVRVSKSAIKAGLSFEHVGNLFISKYKENRHVKAVTVIFVTLPDAPYAELDRLAQRSADITKALNHILADIKIECRACEWKPVCDEVEGMKEMHFKMAEH